MTVKLRGSTGGEIEVADDAVDRYLALGYSKVDAAPKSGGKAPVVKPRAKARKED